MAIRKPDLEDALTIIVPEDRPFMMEDFRNDRIWFFATLAEAEAFQAELMASDYRLSGWLGVS